MQTTKGGKNKPNKPRLLEYDGGSLVQGTHLTFYFSFFFLVVGGVDARTNEPSVLEFFFFSFSCVFGYYLFLLKRDAASIMMRQEVINAVCVYLARSDITQRGA